VTSAYQTLEARFRRAALVEEAAGFLHWDASVMMPEGSAASRAEQIAALQVIAHELLSAPDMAELLDAAAGDATLDVWRAANLREMRRRWIHATALDADLVAARTRANSACEMAWRQARPKSDFDAVLPFLEEVLRLTLEAGQAKADRLGTSVYDALLDQFEPDGRAAEIDPVFDDLAGFLPGFVDAAIERQAEHPPLPLDGPFPVDKQRALGLRIMQAIGFDFTKGRLDESLHPFTGGTPDDLRITTRFADAEFLSALMAVIHETGHALYEAQLPAAWRHQPVGEARGMVVHESQSLLLEMQACRSREYLTFAAPLMRRAFGSDGPAWQVDNLFRLSTAVARGLVRVDADEATYPAHVILRYRLERAIVAGDLALADLPGAWDDGMAALLGVRPPEDRLGCLQDIHWYDGAWGYFPTYTLGAMAAAQLFDAARAADARIVPSIAHGDFRPLLAWLGENVHGKGSLLSTRELLTAATGGPLDPAVFKAHLKRRYLDGEAA
jgi:carboxypeptidase Taq